jgi:Ni,Fe-hydrogenase III small subunit
MFDLLRARFRHGYQAVKNIRTAVVHERYRGFPVIANEQSVDLAECAKVCPGNALDPASASIDIGRCVFCNECARQSNGGIRFTNFHKTAAGSRDRLIIKQGTTAKEYIETAASVNKIIRSLFGRSIKLRSVSAGGCNACELELTACGNVNFDMGRFGIDIVASPRHADGIIITGPISENMSSALQDTYHAIPEPKIVIAMGTCAISGGLFSGSPAIDRSFLSSVNVDLFIPGCPPHPLTVINGLLDLIGRK